MRSVTSVHPTSEIGVIFLAGIVIAATPITTQPRPIHAVGDRLSPRNATPIGEMRALACLE